MSSQQRRGIEPGVYKITNAKGGTALDLSGGDNRTIIGFQYSGGGNQKWTVSQPDNQGNQTIYNEAKNLYLAIEGSPKEWTRVVASSSPTKWSIVSDTKNQKAWRIFFPGTQFNFDLDRGDSKPGTIIHLWGKWEGDQQLWYFERA